ncbi:MAG: hypothetical protein JRI97_04275 [Deltaproteobacteria bacterium]|nr:hypothetical protein [Deltaproteobacteria bacterium]
MSKLLKIRDLVQEMVDKGATSVEEIHRQIADMPFDTLEKIDITAPTTKRVRKIHDNTVGGVYNIIRKINREVGKLAGELLDQVDQVKKDSGENY